MKFNALAFGIAARAGKRVAAQAVAGWCQELSYALIAG
jgi:hypothetical protein